MHIYTTQVETTGDSYMMAAGLPGTVKEHAQAVTNMAFDMRDIIKNKECVDFEVELEVCYILAIVHD